VVINIVDDVVCGTGERVNRYGVTVVEKECDGSFELTLRSVQFGNND
jgi:hypothetical protein